MRREMTGTLTIRLPGPALRKVKDRARALGTTPSELVRRAVEKELGPATTDRTALERTRRWVGSIRSSEVPAGRDARKALEGWEPDRRG